jgi:SP family sugar:H+ symporter-like MFS transporter
MSGIKNAFTIALITNLINVFATIPGLWLVERVGRRQLLFWGALGMTTFHFIVAIVGVTTDSDVANNVLIAFVCLFIAFFAASWGPVAWVVTGEIFPLKVRAKALSVTTATNWLFNWALAYATPYMVESTPGSANMGTNVFFIWGGCTAVGVVFVYFYIYETKGLTLEEVDEMYNTVSSARKSLGWVPAEDYRRTLEDAKGGKGEHFEG